MKSYFALKIFLILCFCAFVAAADKCFKFFDMKKIMVCVTAPSTTATDDVKAFCSKQTDITTACVVANPSSANAACSPSNCAANGAKIKTYSTLLRHKAKRTKHRRQHQQI